MLRLVNKVFSKMMSAFAKEFELLEDNITELLLQAIPGLSTDLLPEWEKDLGLPDGCTPLGQTISDRQKAVHAKYTGQYGQSAQFFIDYAEALGSTIEVVQSAYGVPFRLGDASTPDKTRVGNRLYSNRSVHSWVIRISPTDPNRDMLICIFNRYSQAHTRLLITDL